MTPKEVFLASLSRCEDDEGFIDKFYARFLDSSDEIRTKFIHTNFAQQRQKLRRSLQLCVEATDGTPAGLIELRERSTSHDRYHLNIKPHHYDVWLESLIETAKECDRHWTTQLEEIWRRLLGHVIKRMIAAY